MLLHLRPMVETGRMDIILGHDTALDIWRSDLSNGSVVRAGSLRDPDILRVLQPAHILGRTAAPDAIAALEHTSRYLSVKSMAPLAKALSEHGVALPLNTLVPSRGMRHRSRFVSSRVWAGGFDEGSVCRVALSNDPAGSGQAESVLVASPELVFVQLASKLDDLDLLLVGFELCGCYSMTLDGFVRRPPLTTPSRVFDVTRGLRGCKGVARAIRVLRLVLPQSLSPKETHLVLILCLPASHGGFALPRASLNYRVDFDEEGRALTGSDFALVDIAWPHERVGVEFDGHRDHSTTGKLIKDELRRKALERRGWSITRIRSAQMTNVTQMKAIVRQLADELGHGVAPAEPKLDKTTSLMARLARA